MWTVLLASVLVFSHCGNTSKQTTVHNTVDTVLLYSTDTRLIINTVPVVLSFQLFKNKPPKYNPLLKTLLLLEHPAVIVPPEGVYELYITDRPPDSSLSSSHKGFVTVLDLYSITAPGAKDLLEIDITEHLKKFFGSKQASLSAYINIRFGPIKLPGGNYSINAGELHLNGVRIIQTALPGSR